MDHTEVGVYAYSIEMKIHLLLFNKNNKDSFDLFNNSVNSNKKNN